MEECVFRNEKCHVFRLPPANLLRSSDWEGKHIWSGSVNLVRLRRTPVSFEHRIDLVDASGQLFGSCPLLDESSFQMATDSSRCFVIKISDGDRHAYIGLMFDDRLDALHFRTAVLERNKEIEANRRVAEKQRKLSAGQKISINLEGRIAGPKADNTSLSTGSSGFLAGPINLLQPPSTVVCPRRIQNKLSKVPEDLPPCPPSVPDAGLSSPQEESSNVRKESHPSTATNTATTKPPFSLDDLFA
jgi:hypothetical protein